MVSVLEEIRVRFYPLAKACSECSIMEHAKRIDSKFTENLPKKRVRFSQVIRGIRGALLMSEVSMLNPEQSVASVVADYTECAQIFQQLRIDFCCRGNLSLTEAAKERKLEVSALMAQLEQTIKERRQHDPDSTSKLPTAELVDYIVNKHHAYLRKVLPFLVTLAAKVKRVHGDHNPKLIPLNDAVKAISESLIPHMDDEEANLFPSLKAAIGPTRELSASLDDMQKEHLEVADLLNKIHDATEDFTIPDWACGSYRTLFAELKAMETDIFRHVYLENHALMPRYYYSEEPACCD